MLSQHHPDMVPTEIVVTSQPLLVGRSLPRIVARYAAFHHLEIYAGCCHSIVLIKMSALMAVALGILNFPRPSIRSTIKNQYRF